MSNITVRPARLEEIDLLLEFEQGIVKTERPFDPTLKKGEIHYYDLKQLIELPTAEVVVAEVDNEVAGSGYALLKEAKDYLDHEIYAYLGFMYVKPEFRGMGINKAVLDYLRQWAARQNVSEIRLEVYDDNLIAKRAYEKAGFKGHLLEMRLPTGAESDPDTPS
ncbi:GNAT family N-acetyltransferase [Emticicia sp. 21SJ11W-3]|uniref:GNAT family N-acetyltransferase n=1 Tax=Emticicia sp. 21SJ11W-3 TaxID=2916755 RepID=UPI0020A05DE0|nr:GNAT family N-acetyltransferase [Emticicia sp. 21SJ11W-3]UTA67717.1 GNAT family N-acetyltransferase [Emticicia sp. 21SJ11W-3]